MELEQLLARVAAGETEFRPEGDSPELRVEFGQTVDAACQAFMRGYIASLDTQCGPSFARQCTRAVGARDLTEKGRRFLARCGLRSLQCGPSAAPVVPGFGERILVDRFEAGPARGAVPSAETP